MGAVLHSYSPVLQSSSWSLHGSVFPSYNGSVSAVSGALFSPLKISYTLTPKHSEDWTSRESDGDLSSMFHSELQTNDGQNEEQLQKNTVAQG